MAKSRTRREKAYFRPRARLVGILGNQLIRDQTVGLMELVKNGYDADATKVEISLDNLVDAEKTTVRVRDNGTGMNRETILKRWLEPATGEKVLQKEREEHTRLGRSPLGEKGVGRFAAHKLGHKFTLVSRAEGSESEVAIEIDWDVFDAHDKYLESVPIELEEREPIEFAGDASGTLLVMTGAREPWTERDVKKLSQALRRLNSPFKGAEDFSVSLRCPEFPDHEDLTPSDILERAHFRLLGIVDRHGTLDFEYKFNLPGVGAREESGKQDLRRDDDEWCPVDRMPTCGPFLIYLYAWDRTLALLKACDVEPADINAYCGVSVYREGIRVLPYGEPGDDWLELDQKRINVPARRLGNRNVIGYVEINQAENGQLHDKTNREGLIENGAFRDFRRLVFSTVAVLQTEANKDREKKKDPTKPELPDAVEDLKKAIIHLQETGSEVEEIVSKLKEDKATRPFAEELEHFPRKISELRKKSEQVEESYNIAKSDFDSERDLLLGLAGIGLAAERFTHEFARLVKDAGTALTRVKRSLEKLHYRHVDLTALEAALDALSSDVRALSPLFYVRRAPKVKQVSLGHVMENVRLLNRTTIEDAGIDYHVEEKSPLTVLMREGQCTQVFNNLVDNSIFWLGRLPSRAEREIRIVIDGNRRVVLVSDSGPGIMPRHTGRIFEPFFSTKPEGRGLGLWIAHETLIEYDSTIELLDNEDARCLLKGANFLITFGPSTKVQ